MLKLNTIRAHQGATTKRKRLGRGSGSGLGATAGKGDKGQLARSGGSVRPGFEGGQMPLYRRIPKRGFTNPGQRDTLVLNLVDLERYDATMKEISLQSIADAKLLAKSGKPATAERPGKVRHDRLTILGTGELTKAFVVKAHKVSASAEAKIKKAGGSVELLPIPGKKPVRKEKSAG